MLLRENATRSSHRSKYGTRRVDATQSKSRPRRECNAFLDPFRLTLRSPAVLPPSTSASTSLVLPGPTASGSSLCVARLVLSKRVKQFQRSHSPTDVEDFFALPHCPLILRTRLRFRRRQKSRCVVLAPENSGTISTCLMFKWKLLSEWKKTARSWVLQHLFGVICLAMLAAHPRSQGSFRFLHSASVARQEKPCSHSPQRFDLNRHGYGPYRRGYANATTFHRVH